MNRQNFPKHLLLAVTIIMLAAMAGQIRRWQRDYQPRRSRTVLTTTTTTIPKRTQALEVLVRFRPGTTLDRIRAIALRQNDRIEDRIESVNNLVVMEDADGADMDEIIRGYSNLPDVEYVEPNYTISLDPEPQGTEPPSYLDSAENGPNDPMFGDQWSLENSGQRGGRAKADISALAAWDKTKGSDKVVVAVLDSGVDYTHPDLIKNMWVRPPNMARYTDDQIGTVDDAHGFNAIDDTGDPMDDNGHGTHCAGIIGAEGDNGTGIAGVNWKVEIMPLKFMNANGSGTTKDAIKAINYVIERKRAGVNVRVINASWGSTAKSKALEDAIREAGDEGILFIAASGNSSADADRSPHYPSGYQLPNVISVAALNRNDELASFSNYGAKTVHIAAPGAEILSTWLGGAFEEHSGTSMATPEVVGVAALVLSLEPDMSVKELRQRLMDSTDPLPALKGKVVTGGRINAARAVGAK
ncbi:MAG TPA: S8 family serine peptidase [Pyrinomonadaceae bacterium]|nr:S8 family serine peptidase [Pyrinomonadaceae bacterium]